MEFLTYPYTLRIAVGGTKSNFIITDDVAQPWYDTPRKQQCAPPFQVFEPDQNQSISWPNIDILREKTALPGSVMADCGCHPGLTTILFAAWVEHNGHV